MVKKLKRKNRQKKSKNITFDIAKIKKIIYNDLYSNYNTIDEENKVNNNDAFQILSKKQEDNIYYNKYTKYITEEFNSTIVNMLVVFINKSKTFPLKYQKEPFFIIKLVNLLKHLLMNEFELSYFTILLDRIGWEYKFIEHWTYAVDKPTIVQIGELALYGHDGVEGCLRPPCDDTAQCCGRDSEKLGEHLTIDMLVLSKLFYPVFKTHNSKYSLVDPLFL